MTLAAAPTTRIATPVDAVDAARVLGGCRGPGASARLPESGLLDLVLLPAEQGIAPSTAAEVVRRVAEYQPKARILDEWRRYVSELELAPELEAALVSPREFAAIVEHAERHPCPCGILDAVERLFRHLQHVEMPRIRLAGH